MAKSLIDYIFRRLALDYLPEETRSYMGIHSSAERTAALDADQAYQQPIVSQPEPAKSETANPEVKREIHSSAELFELLQGTASDAPLCFNCGIKMRPSGSCHVCEGCGSTSGCS
jgi:ribonucleoside-diphosphate reductase alpha chain